MAIIKCKMCGGSLEISEDMSVAECEYCGTMQTVPKIDDEKKLTLFARANRLRLNNEFDKAAGIYESIIADFPEEAEAYWGLVLCTYGIEYVDDPATAKKVPTCHRSSFDSVMDDANFEQACENADAMARRVYRDEAKAIEELRKRIIEVSSKEEPYDVFISYKELDENGERTIDSVIAQDIYKELTGEGYRVFFSRISLEDKLGVEYEPYIFAALNSAKVMLVVGTDFENFNAVWVKNEWSRFLMLMAKGEKKTLIPCFKGIDAYDMPKEFNKLAAQDMGKVGAMQDLTRGVEKIIGGKKEEKPAVAVPVYQSESNAKGAAALKRGFMAIEDGEWANADKYFEQALELDAECAEAYWGKFLAENKAKNADEFVNKSLGGIVAQKSSETACEANTGRIFKSVAENKIANYLSEDEIRKLYYSGAPTYQETASSVKAQAFGLKRSLRTNKTLEKAKKFAAGEFADMLAATEKKIAEGSEKIQANAEATDESAKQKAITAYKAHLDDADKKAAELKAGANAKRKADYGNAITKMAEAKTAAEYAEVRKIFVKLTDFKESAKKAEECNEAAKNAENEAAYLAALKLQQEAKSSKNYSAAAKAFEKLGDYKDSEERKNACLANEKEIIKKKKKKFKLAGIAAGVAAVLALVFVFVINPMLKYNKAVELEANGDFAKAAIAYGKLGDYKDAHTKSLALWDEVAVRDTISAGKTKTNVIKSDGTAGPVANNYITDISSFTDVIAISGSTNHTVGLKSDGTVVATGNNDRGQCDVEDWTDIVAICVGEFHTVGLKSNGTVVAVGDNDNGQCDVEDWTDIVAISAGNQHTVGLKSDGTVVAVGNNSYGKCSVEDWTDIVAISADSIHTVGLKSDGTVVAVGNNGYGKCNVENWTDIVAISAGGYHTVGLKVDGTVVAVGNNNNGQGNVSGWTDIVAISAGNDYTVGLKSDGTLVAVGNNDDGQCDVTGIRNIKLP